MSRLYSPTSALYHTPYYSFPSAAFATHLTHSPHTPALQLILGFSTTLSFNFGNKCEPPLRMRPRPRLPLSLPLLAGDEDNIVCKLSDNRLPPILTWLRDVPPPPSLVPYSLPPWGRLPFSCTCARLNYSTEANPGSNFASNTPLCVQPPLPTPSLPFPTTFLV